MINTETNKFKHIREGLFHASHPLYDAMNKICNPSVENCGETTTYTGKTFKLCEVKDTYFDTAGNPEREVTVINLNKPDTGCVETIPDSNGRIGRMVMFWQCLQAGTVPFIISEELRLYYYRGLQNWGEVNGYLRDTCLTAQDHYKTLLDYLKIKYLRTPQKGIVGIRFFFNYRLIH